VWFNPQYHQINNNNNEPDETGSSATGIKGAKIGIGDGYFLL
jgi:hypothetical protein